MGYPQPLADVLDIDHMLLMPEERAHLLWATCRTPIRQGPRARADAGHPELRLQPEVIGGLEQPR
ncbi:hypothetical protein [Blastococcus aggregatus]|uniref:hypothetical protein n=1 Tax=Blastococcus aggregatus TaxID=38502 RepID=UPI000BE49062|nr:hypothetical protein [Blastococcus aggregatus]